MAVETDILPPRYRGPQRIGKGGMGEIYRATDTTLGRAVAVKVLTQRYAEDDAVRERFTREALAAARLSGNPNIVTIYDVGEHNDRPFIVMEYMSGGSLDDRLRREGAQPPEQALRWLDEAAGALDYANNEGVVHRDVKPANLLLNREGHVHVADFGVASAAGLDSMTMTGTIVGTAGYLSPEQATGERATPASDRYSLAVVAWELLTGERPFAADSVTAEATAHVNAPVPSICERKPDLPCELDPVFRRGMAKDPADRYPCCADFVADLRHELAEAAGTTRIISPVPETPAAPPPPPPRLRPARSRWPLLLGLLLAAGIAGAILAAVLTHGGNDTKAAPPPGARTVVKTITAQGSTVRETVTTTPQRPATTTAAAASPASGGNGHADNDAGYAKMQAGDLAGAVPLLQRAVQELQGTGPSDPYEAYANYNLGYALYQLGRCAEAVPYLQRADQLEGATRHEPRQALKKAQKCAEKG